MFQYNIVAWSDFLWLVIRNSILYVRSLKNVPNDVFMDDAPLESSIGIILLGPSFLMLAVWDYI